jgi:RNA polymerase sigma-70 factor (ECF subfamily)
VDWTAILLLYEGLTALSPTLGVLVGRTAALCEAGQPGAALADLDGIERCRVEAYQPFWATRAHVLQQLGRSAEAAKDYARAAGLTEDAAVRAYLLNRRRSLAG